MNRFHYGTSKDSNLLYLTQHWISDPHFWLEIKGQQKVFIGSIDIAAFKENGRPGVEVFDMALFKQRGATRNTSVVNAAIKILTEFNVEDELLVPATFPVFLADGLRSAGYLLTVVEEWVTERAIKTKLEIEHITKNMEVVCGAYDLLETQLRASVIKNGVLHCGDEVVTSESLRKQVGRYFFDEGYISPEGMIISSGDDAAKPHHCGSGPIKAHAPIIADLFPQHQTNFYFADMTRTYVKGKPSQRFAAMYEAVQVAQAKTIEMIAPGIKACDLYAESARIITEAGFDVGEIGYTHSLGHGFGVEIHEAPHLSPVSDEVLVPGHVITIEPGLYYEGVGGVRIEDVVVITEDGHKNITNYPQNWIIP